MLNSDFKEYKILLTKCNLYVLISDFATVDSSADQAMIHLLAGLEDDEFEIGQQNTLSQHFSSGICKNSQNSDDEENEPQIEKEDIELSLLMSQRWDSNTKDASAKRRYVLCLGNCRTEGT